MMKCCVAAEQRDYDSIFVCRREQKDSCVKCGTFGKGEVPASAWGTKECDDGNGITGEFVAVESPSNYLVIAEIKIQGIG